MQCWSTQIWPLPIFFPLKLLHRYFRSFVAESTPPVANRSPTHAQDVEIDQFAVFGRNSQLLQQVLNDVPEPCRIQCLPPKCYSQVARRWYDRLGISRSQRSRTIVQHHHLPTVLECLALAICCSMRADRWVSMAFRSDPTDHAVQEDCAVVDESIKAINRTQCRLHHPSEPRGFDADQLPAHRGQFPATDGMLLLGSFGVSSAHRIFLPIVDIGREPSLEDYTNVKGRHVKKM